MGTISRLICSVPGLALAIALSSGAAAADPRTVAGENITVPVADPVYQGLKATYATTTPACSSIVQIFKNKSYKKIGQITDGFTCPIGLALDKTGNLYVTSIVLDAQSCATAGTIQEYIPHGTTPQNTLNGACLNHSHGFVSVTTDANGVVYAGTDNLTYNGTFITPAVVQWQPGNPNPRVICLPPAQTLVGIAVDNKGNVFVRDNGGLFIECTNGTPTFLDQLNHNFGEFAGIAIDKQNNLVIPDPAHGTVSVVPPPYTTVARTIGSGYSSPSYVSLDASYANAYITDPTAGKVFVVNYRTGANVTSFALPNALTVAHGPEAVK